MPLLYVLGLLLYARPVDLKKKKKRAPVMDTLLAWRRPTLTGGEPPTTIGAERLNFRVRYGNGCDLLAIVTKLLSEEFVPSKLDKAEEEE